MRVKLLIIFSLFMIISYSQVTSTGIGDIKIGMSLPELSKLTGMEVELLPDEGFGEIELSYKNVNYLVTITRIFDIASDNSKPSVFSIETKDPSMKTTSGIGIGSSQEDIWNAYKNNSIEVWNHWDKKKEDYSSDARVFSVLFDEENMNVIYFELENNKVTSITVSYNPSN